MKYLLDTDMCIFSFQGKLNTKESTVLLIRHRVAVIA